MLTPQIKERFFAYPVSWWACHFLQLKSSSQVLAPYLMCSLIMASTDYQICDSANLWQQHWMLDFLVNWKFSFLILFQLLIQLVHQYMVQALNNLLFATIFSICQYRQYIISKRFINSTDYWQYHSFSQRSFIQLYPGGACIITNFLANYQCILN